MKWIRKGEHIENCASVENVKNGTWESVWGVVDTEWRNRSGNKTPTTRGYIAWVVACCNAPDCEAKLMMPLDDFLKGLPKK